MVQGENGLFYKAEFDINEFKKNGEEMLRIFRRIETEGNKAFNFKPPSNAAANTAVSNLTQAQTTLTRAMRDSLMETERLRQENLRLQNQWQQGAITINELTARQRENNIARQEQVAAERQARQSMDAATGSYREAQLRLRNLGNEIRNTAGGFANLGAAQRARIDEYNQLNTRLREFDRQLGIHNRNVGAYSTGLNGVRGQLMGLATSFVSVYAVFGGLSQIISTNAEVSDSLADVQRTAQLTAQEANNLVEAFKKFDTRTSLKGLVDIATIGGQMGVAKEDIAGFTKSIDQLSVVLAGEISGGAQEVASALGKINGVFKTQAKESTNIETAYNRTGSAILGLGQAGLATGAFLQDFTLRVGGAAVAANISLPTMLAYGSVLEEAGSSAEVSGTAINRLIGTLSAKRGEFFAIAKMADAKLTLDSFTKTINTDANAALQMFFKGLNTGNPTLTEFNDRLEAIGMRAGPGKNAIIALAQNQEKLSEKIKLSNKDYMDAGKVVDQFALKNDNLAGAIAKLWNGISNAFTSSSASKTLAELINSMVNGKSSVENLTSAYFDNKKEVESSEAQMKPLLTRFDELQERARLSGGAIRLNKGEQEELRDVTSKIGALMPGVITQFDNYGNALDINRSKVDQMTKAQRELLRVQNREAISSANTKFDNATSEQKRMQQAIIDGAKSEKSNSTLEAGREAAILLSGLAYQSAKSIRDLGGALTQQQQEVINFYEKVTPVAKAKTKEIVTVVNDGTGEITARTADVIRAEIKSLQGLQKSLDVSSNQYKDYTKKILALKKELRLANGGDGTGKTDQGLKNQVSLQSEIDELSERALRKQKTRDEEEIDSITDKYNKIRKKVKEFYDDPVNAGKKVNSSDLAKSEAFEKAEAKANQDLAILKNSIEMQKAVFSEYESYKSQVGKEEADKRFAADLKGVETFSKYIDTLMPDEGDLSAYANKVRDLVNKDLKPQAKKDAFKNETEELSALLVATQSFQDKMTKLTEDYELEKERLRRAGKVSNMLILDQTFKEEKDKLITNEISKMDVAKRFAEETLILTRSSLKEQIKGMENALKDVSIPGDVKRKIEETLSDLKINLKIGADQVNLDALRQKRLDILTLIEEESKKAEPEVTELNESLAETNYQITELDKNSDGIADGGGLKKFLDSLQDSKGLKAAVDGLSLASDAALTLADGLGGVNTEAGYTLTTIGELAGAAADLGVALISGDPVKIIGSAIKAVGALFSIGKRVREMNLAARKEVEDFYANAIAGEREYQDMLKERELQTIRNNKVVLQGIRDEMELRKSQALDYSVEADEIMRKLQDDSYVSGEKYIHGTWFRKAKVEKSYSSLQGKSFQELSQLLAQGKLEGETKALVERLVELEKKGYDATAAMAELAQETSQVFTGTSSNALSDSLLEMFRSGKTGAKELGEFFKDTMDDAALSIFKNKVLAGAMEGFYKKFDEAAQSGDELTAAEIAQLKLDFDNMTADAKKRFEEYQKITGSKISIEIDPNIESLKDKIFTDLTNVTLENGVMKLGDSITETISNAILEGFQAQMIADGLKDFYAKIAEFQKGGKEITKEQVEELKYEYASFLTYYNDELTKLELATGLSFRKLTDLDAEAAEKRLEDAKRLAEEHANAVKSTIESIVDGVAGIFTGSENAAKAFIDNFDKLVNDNILADFKKKFLTEKLTSFYSDFAALTKDGAIPAKSQIEEMRLRYESIISAGDAELRRLQELTGQDLIPDQVVKVDGEFQSFKDSFADVFATLDGQTVDAGKKFEDTMKQAVLNAFKTNYLTGALKGFYDQLNEFTKDGQVLTSVQISSLRSQYDAMVALGMERMRDFERVSGLSFSVPDAPVVADPLQSSLAKGITQITSTQASALEGITRGQYGLQKEMVRLLTLQTTLMAGGGKSTGDLFNSARDNFQTFTKIEYNTAQTVRELKLAVVELKAINAGVNSKGDSMRGTGLV